MTTPPPNVASLRDQLRRNLDEVGDQHVRLEERHCHAAIYVSYYTQIIAVISETPDAHKCRGKLPTCTCRRCDVDDMLDPEYFYDDELTLVLSDDKTEFVMTWTDNDAVLEKIANFANNGNYWYDC